MSINQTITINNKPYTFITAYQDNDKLRNNLNILAQKIFRGLSFEKWYSQGYWNEACVPYSLFDSEKCVANIFANIFHMTLFGVSKCYIQLGTVMTDNDYRNQGLSRFLMENIIRDWQDKCDAIYLYANDSVLDYYPKFGFEKSYEYQYSMPISPKTGPYKELDMTLQSDRDFLVNKCRNGNSFSVVQTQNCHDVALFHCTMFMSDCVYYLEGFDAIVIAKQNDDNTLFCYDVFHYGDKQLVDILSAISTIDTKKIIFGFTPKDTSNCDVFLHEEEDTTLFVLKGKENIFENNKLMLPIICHT